ncbi:hypothetical protein CsatB_002393 [Cannabis sativa]
MASINGGESFFTIGSDVEVGTPDGGFIPATIIGRGSYPTSFFVKYKTLKSLRREFDVSLIRPSPPKEIEFREFKLDQEVDAYYNGKWWEGLITNVSKDCLNFAVSLYENDEIEVQYCNLRPHRDWVDDHWVPPLVKTPVSDSNGAKTMEEFEVGSLVEIRNEEEGLEGSWYTASIIRIMENDKYYIQYKTIKTETGEKYLCEEAERRNIRPVPPEIIMADSFSLNEEVDAYYNDGWWEGAISKVLSRGRYKVYFENSCEEIVFEHEDLRPRQNWINRTWVSASN